MQCDWIYISNHEYNLSEEEVKDFRLFLQKVKDPTYFIEEIVPEADAVNQEVRYKVAYK